MTCITVWDFEGLEITAQIDEDAYLDGDVGVEGIVFAPPELRASGLPEADKARRDLLAQMLREAIKREFGQTPERVVWTTSEFDGAEWTFEAEFDPDGAGERRAPISVAEAGYRVGVVRGIDF